MMERSKRKKTKPEQISRGGEGGNHSRKDEHKAHKTRLSM